MQKKITIEKLAQMVERSFEKTATKDDVGRIERRLDEVGGRLAEVERMMATKAALQETEQHLLDAIRGIEVRKQDFEALQDEVRALGERVGELEKKRGSRR